MPQLGPFELGLILVIVVIVFGVGRLTDIGKALGKTVREFRDATSGDNAKKDDGNKGSKNSAA